MILGLGGVAAHAFPRVPHGHPGYFNRAFLQQDCSAVTGACMLVRKKVFEEAGGFDETNLAISFNDVDFCLRLRTAGLRNIWTPYANLIHHESASRGHQRTAEEQAQFMREATYVQRKWESSCCTIRFTTRTCLLICRASISLFRRVSEIATSGNRTNAAIRHQELLAG